MSAIIQSFEEAGRTLVLRDLGTHQELLLDQVPILSSAALGTEIAFGKLAVELAPSACPRVLIGGLGFGATASAALSAVGAESEVVVVEKLATVIELVRAGVVRAPAGLLDDPRLRLVQGDVGDVLERESGFDVMLLDVDNGPQWASFRSNARLYCADWLRRARAALVPGGALAVWSGYPADRFVARLREAGLLPTIQPLYDQGRVRARAYIGRRPPEPPQAVDEGSSPAAYFDGTQSKL